MAPKSLPPAAKQALILQWFHNSLSAHSIKDLEKALPSVASINGMQVKDYIQALTDENQIRVEKIGSGNWYWSFPSDAKKSKERILDDLKAEENKISTGINETEVLISEETAARAEHGSKDNDRSALLQHYRALQADTSKLEQELTSYSENDPMTLLRKKEQAIKQKHDAERWTDNLEAIEYYLISLTQDRRQVATIMENACPGEYVAGEGLKEL